MFDVFLCVCGVWMVWIPVCFLFVCVRCFDWFVLCGGFVVVVMCFDFLSL